MIPADTDCGDNESVGSSQLSVFIATRLLFFTSSIVASLMFYLWSKPPRVEVGASLVGAMLMVWRFGLYGAAYAQLMVFLGYWGFCAIVVTVFAGVFVGRVRRERIRMLDLMLAIPAWDLVTVVLLTYANDLVPKTLDYYLYAFDWSLGWPPGFLLARMLFDLGPVRQLAEACYMNLTLALCAGYLVQKRFGGGAERNYLKLVFTIAFAGFLLYLVFPAVGTVVLFPKTLDPPAVSTVAVEQSPSPGEPRNCIPSLHTAWLLALWWTCPKERSYRWIYGVFIGLSLGYTQACGHYFADLITAAPFALAVYAATYGSGASGRRTAVASAGMFAGWLVFLRYGSGVAAISPVVPWSLVAATLVGCFVLKRWVNRSLAANDEHDWRRTSADRSGTEAGAAPRGVTRVRNPRASGFSRSGKINDLRVGFWRVPRELKPTQHRKSDFA